MSKISDSERLVFPSGRSIASVKKDAKKLSRAESIPLSAALDRLSIENGVNERWANAIAVLEANHITKGTDLVSASGLDLFDIRSDALALERSTNGQLSLDDALVQVCRDRGITNPNAIARIAYTKYDKNVFHVVSYGPCNVYTYVSNKSFLNEKNRRALFIAKSIQPKCALHKNVSHLHSGGIVYGDVTTLENIVGVQNTKDGIWLCKYGPNEPLIHLQGISALEAEALSMNLGIANSMVDVSGNTRSIEDINNVQNCSAFSATGKIHCPSMINLIKWCHRYPNKAKGAGDVYAGGWGDWALEQTLQEKRNM